MPNPRTKHRKDIERFPSRLDLILDHLTERVLPYGYVISGICFAVLLWMWWATDGILFAAKYWYGKIYAEGPPQFTFAELGQMGDLFGGVNALFAACAFIGVAFAAYYQHQTFLFQKDDSKKAKAVREEELFNEYFFRMLGEVRTLLDGMFLKPAELEYYTPADANNAVFNQLERHLKLTLNVTRDTEALNGQAPHTLVSAELGEYYEKIFRANNLVLAPVMRNLFHVFDMIHESKFDFATQSRYAKIARASLNNRVLLLLLLNGLSYQGRKFKPLVEKFGLLKHLEPDFDGTNTAKEVAEVAYHKTAFSGYGYRACFYDEAGEENKDEQAAKLLAVYRQGEPARRMAVVGGRRRTVS